MNQTTDAHVCQSWRWAWLSLMAAVLVACQPAASPMTSKEKAFMSTYTEHLVPRCFGRYLIDLPADMQPGKLAAATFAVEPYTETSGAIRVTVTPQPQDVFDRQLARRKAELGGMHIELHPDWPYLERTIALPSGSGVVFNRSENGGSRGARTLELHGWKGGYAIAMTVAAGDDSYPEYEKLAKNLQFGNDVPSKLAQLQSLYARIRGRKPDEVPAGPGACFQNGFIAGPVDQEMSEDIAMDFVSKSMPDVVINAQSDSGIHEDDTLLDRMGSIQASLKAADGHIIRKGRRETESGLRFEEVLSTGKTPNDHIVGQYFTLEANSKIGSAKTPLLNIDFWNGNRETDDNPKPLAKASLSEAEAAALWDAVTKTLRPRPNGF